MTEDELREIEDRASKATVGPWVSTECANGGRLLKRGKESLPDRHPQSSLQVVPSDDATFIAHARADVPTLLAEIRRLKALLDDNFGGR